MFVGPLAAGAGSEDWGPGPDEGRMGDWGDTEGHRAPRLLVLIKLDGTLHTSVSTEENGRPHDERPRDVVSMYHVSS